ncbi:hypothetical protein P26059A_0063 [Curvibacter phage P26059A]|nr:hypothetical protein P26059A_0063 [Curvibacter phage P26059A]
MSKQNKPHKHAELIKAWADGSVIECRVHDADRWSTVNEPCWVVHYQYRIKPEPKPDRVRFARFSTVDEFSESFAWCFDIGDNCNTRVTFDGETGKLKSVEVL